MVTYGITLGPLASVDLFQESIEQPPEIQGLQKNKNRGRSARTHTKNPPQIQDSALNKQRSL